MADDPKENTPPTEKPPDLTTTRAVRMLLDVLASTQTTIVLLGATALATLAGTLLPRAAAFRFVYGRLWFHLLLGFLGLNLVACMVWRRRVSLARAWSLLMHAGILLVLLGALVTLVSAERGSVRLSPGYATDSYTPLDTPPRGHENAPLGFTLGLVDFRIVWHPPVDRLSAVRGDGALGTVRIGPEGSATVPGTDLEILGATFTPGAGPGLVEITAPGNVRLALPAKVGTVQVINEDRLAVRILRYEPAHMETPSRDGHAVVGSAELMPIDPALQIVIVRNGREGPPEWLFANPERRRLPPGSRGPNSPAIRFLHPAFPRLEARVKSPSGERTIAIDHGIAEDSPWGDGISLEYKRDAPRVREYESEVEVFENGKAVRTHTITVNAPLVHKGTRLSQSSCYWARGPVTVLGVSRDPGVWLVYAGFIAGIAGLVGMYHVAPLLRRLRRGRARRENSTDAIA